MNILHWFIPFFLIIGSTHRLSVFYKIIHMKMVMHTHFIIFMELKSSPMENIQLFLGKHILKVVCDDQEVPP